MMKIDTYLLGTRVYVEYLGLTLKSKVRTLLKQEQTRAPDKPVRIDNAARFVVHWYARKRKEKCSIEYALRYVKNVKDEMKLW